MVKRINLILSPREEKVVSLLLKRYGGNATTLLRSILQQKFDQAFPPYKEGKKGGQNVMLIDLTPEQLCEQVGGKVDSMGRTCELSLDFTGQALTYFIPFGDPNDMLKRMNELRQGGGRPPIEI